MPDTDTEPQQSNTARASSDESLKTPWSNLPRWMTPPWQTVALLFTGILVPEILCLRYLGDNSPVWMTDAVAVATLLRCARRFWPALILVQFIADISANRLVGEALAISFDSAICDTFDVLTVSNMLHLVGRSGPLFASLGQILKFGAVCIVSPIFSGFLGAMLVHKALHLTFEDVWVTWYLSAMFGLLIVTPFLLLWTDRERFQGASRWAMTEIILLTLLVGFVGWIDFSVHALPGMFLSFPFLLLAAFRGGLLGATSSAVMLVVVATGLTLAGKGEIANYPGSTEVDHVFVLQLYFATILLSSLPVAVMLEQRKLLSQFQTVTELSRMARHDPLTNLPNRLLFHERLAWTQAGARRDGGYTALLMLDLDRFKPVNDLHGHAAGDRLLVMVAQRLSEAARKTDTVARLGGDEFAIVGNVDNSDMARSIAQRAIKVLSKPFTFMDLTVQIGCSIGIALSPADGTDGDILVQRADAALYRAKAAGRNGFRFFETGMDDAVRQRAELEVELRQAILLDQVSPRYQPIVALGDGRIVGFEMLARWTHPIRGDISPSIFIPLAESVGLIGILSEQLIRKACLASLTWPEDMFVSVNVSPVQLRDRALPGLMRSILAETGLTPLRLEIELTESALIEDFALAHEILVDMKSTGIRLALDDFGTGYSSLRHLQDLPLDKIKIDMGFVKTMTSIAASRKIVAGVIGLGHSLGLPIVAEGIEDEEAARQLNLMGCDLGQGWLYGRAVTAQEVTVMLNCSLMKRAILL
jgi:diguanylate cyclase (GGDEF)-like protein